MLELLPDEKYLPAITKAVCEAKKSIDIMAFKLEITATVRGRRLNAFWAELITTIISGVEVRLITNEREGRCHIPGSNNYAIERLKQQGVLVRKLQGTRICHAKVIMIDRQTVYLGSHNLSVTSCSRNLETSLVTDDKVLATYMNDFYEKAWLVAKKI